MKHSKIVLLILILALVALAACLALFFRSSGCGTNSGFTTGALQFLDNVVKVRIKKLQPTSG